jgi:hypothetical protein
MDGQHLFLGLVIGGFACFILGLFTASIWTGLGDHSSQSKR